LLGSVQEDSVRITIVDALDAETDSKPALLALAALGAGPLHHLADERYAPCVGCFECWTTHPGTCRAHDSANGLMRDLIASDEAVWLVRPAFGCWSPEAKQALDKVIGLLSPFFSSVHGETHHQPRYERYPRLGVVAWMPAGAPANERERFRLLVARNALNLQSTDSWVAFVTPDDGPEALAASIHRARADGWRSFPEVALPPVRPGAVGVPPMARPRRVCLVVGSAKPAGTSTSEHLGRALLERLAGRGWAVNVVHVARVVRLGRAENPALRDAVHGADLVLLAAPVYVDCLPALVLAGLASLVGASGPAFVPILQCGFPERTHVTLALEIVERAVAQLGGRWAGHLALGAGTPYATADLSAPTGMAADQVVALDLAAAALDRGEPIPAEATERFARNYLGPWLYRAAGQAGWVWEAWRHGALGSIGARPFEERPAPLPVVVAKAVE
jgi:hypothetical protein